MLQYTCYKIHGTMCVKGTCYNTHATRFMVLCVLRVHVTKTYDNIYDAKYMLEKHVTK